jgi:trans-aconitate 2-methyltransferase
MQSSKEWDAQTYDRIADPMARWGMAVVERLQLRGDETVLDAGCGSGRVTAHLLERLPAGRVVALDASQAMLDQAAERLVAAAGRLDLVLADLSEPLPISRRVDAVLSTATLHWVMDHERMFSNLAAVIVRLNITARRGG